MGDLAERIRSKLEPFDGSSFLERKKGRLRRRYITAYQRLCREGLDLDRDSDIAAFVKLERYYEDGKSPRMIMGRNPKFNVLYAQIIEPIEKAFFSLPQVANACDNFSCGKKFENLLGGWFMENDMSKFEGSQRYEALRLEHMVYSLVFPESRDLLDVLFAYKIRKKGHTNTGVNFEFVECRGSGDMDTSLGNGILNYIATQYFLVKNYCQHCELASCTVAGCRSYKFVVKGDDSYASIPRFRDDYDNTYSLFGFDAKIVIRKQPEDVEFCSGHFLEYMPGKYIYVQKLQKLIESLTTCINADAIRCGWVKHYYASLGKMYKVLYAGVPVYEDVADFLIRAGGSLGVNTSLINSYNLLDMYEHHDGNKLADVQSALIWVSLSMINKMDFAELEHIRRWFSSNELTFSDAYSKRCNLKTPKLVEIPRVDFELLNIQIANHNMPTTVSKYYKRLRRDRNKVLYRGWA